MTDEQKYEIECQLLGRCLAWIKAKMKGLDHDLYVIRPPLVEWYRDPETDKQACMVTVHHCAVGGLFNKCGIKATEPWDSLLPVPANYDLAKDEDPR